MQDSTKSIEIQADVSTLEIAAFNDSWLSKWGMDDRAQFQAYTSEKQQQ